MSQPITTSEELPRGLLCTTQPRNLLSKGTELVQLFSQCPFVHLIKSSIKTKNLEPLLIGWHTVEIEGVFYFTDFGCPPNINSLPPSPYRTTSRRTAQLIARQSRTPIDGVRTDVRPEKYCSSYVLRNILDTQKALGADSINNWISFFCTCAVTRGHCPNAYNNREMMVLGRGNRRHFKTSMCREGRHKAPCSVSSECDEGVLKIFEQMLTECQQPWMSLGNIPEGDSTIRGQYNEQSGSTNPKGRSAHVSTTLNAEALPFEPLGYMTEVGKQGAEGTSFTCLAATR